MSLYDYEKEQEARINNLRVQLLARPLNLGGTSTGGGGPTGGFTGYLPQTRVSYDASELAASGITNSGSLKDNLNHIRLRLQELETGTGGHIIKYNGTEVTGTTLDFTDGFTLTDDGDTIVFTSDGASSEVKLPTVTGLLSTPPTSDEIGDILTYTLPKGTSYLAQTDDGGINRYYLAVSRHDGQGWAIGDLNFPLADSSTLGEIPISDGKRWITINPSGMFGGGVGGSLDLTGIILVPGPTNTTISGVQVYSADHLGFSTALANTVTNKKDTIILPTCTISDGTYPTYIIKSTTSIIGQGTENSVINGQLNLAGSCKLENLQVNGRPNATTSWAINGNNTYQYLTHVYVRCQPFEVDYTPYALYDCSFVYSNDCHYRAISMNGATFLVPFGSSLDAESQLEYPIGGYARGSVITGGGKGLDLFTREYSNYASIDVGPTNGTPVYGGGAGNGVFHATDIASGILTRHLPLPTTSGMVPVSNGVSWETRDISTLGESSGGGYTLIGDITLSEDGPIVFSGIPQNFTHLHIVGRVRSNYGTGTGDYIGIRVGENTIDPGSNYAYMNILMASSASASQSNATSYINGGIIALDADTAGYFSPFRCEIYYYRDTQFKTFETQTSKFGGGYRESTGGGLWKSTNPINIIQITGEQLLQLKAGSRITLYGI
jgi:hypothetical protein